MKDSWKFPKNNYKFRRLFALGGNDKHLSLWSPETGLRVRQLSGHAAYIEAYAFSPDGSRIASRDRTGTLKLWHVPSGTELLTLQANRLNVFRDHLGWSPDGRTLLGNVERGEFWDASPGYTVSESGGFADELAVLVSSASRRLITMRETADEYLNDALAILQKDPLNIILGDQAAQSAAEAVHLNPEDPNAWMIWALGLFFGHNWQLSLSKVIEADRLGGHDFPLEALAIRTVVEFREGNPEPGRRRYRELQEMTATREPSPSTQRMVREAELAWMEHLDEQDELDADSLLQLGLLRWASGHYTKTLKQFFRSHEPEEIVDRFKPLLADEGLGLVRFLHWVIRVVPQDEKAVIVEDLLAFCESEGRDDLRARLLVGLDSTEGLHIEHPAARAMIVSVLDDATETFEHLLKSVPDAALQAGSYLASTERWAPAARCLETWLNHHPGHPWATTHLEHVRSQLTTEP
ncbi:MAG: hypothetical protein AAF492_11870 [Verrucomicrobiota bacterium]